MRATINLSMIRATVFGLPIAVVLGFVAGFQLLGQSPDYENYLFYFDFARDSSFPDLLEYRFEPGFAVLTYLLATFQLSGPAIYSSIAGASMFLKYLSLRTTENFWPTLTVFTLYYTARYFTLFEMTVLRTAVALSIAIFVFYSRKAHEYRVKHLLFLLGSVSMHYSAIIFIPIYLIRPSKRMTVLAVGAAFFITILAARSLALVLLPSYVPVFATYDEFTRATLLPIPFAVDLFFLAFVLSNWEKNDGLMKSCAVGMVISAAFHFSLLEYSLIASRFRELLSVFFLLYVTRSVGYAQDEIKYTAIAYAILSGTLHFYGVYIYEPLLK